MGVHLSAAEIARFRRGELSPGEVITLAAHLRACAECAELALSQIGDESIAAMQSTLLDAAEDHPDLHPFVDGTLSFDERELVEAHLAVCADCSDEVDDLRRVRATLHGATPSRFRGQFMLAAAALFVVLVTGTLVMRRSPRVETSPSSIAVLPLRNTSNDARDAFLSVGIADALVGRLQQIDSLPIRPISAALGFQSFQDAQRAGESLHVDSVLEGRFAVLDGRVRVTVQLTDPRTGRAIWNESIDGPRGDLLRLVDALAARTTKHLDRPETTGASAVRSKNPRAYEEYLKARSMGGSLVTGRYEEQVAALERAIALDPEFAAAHANLAIALSLGVARGLEKDPDTIDRAERHARQAVRLDPNLAEAHAALARFFVRRPDRYRDAVRELLAAIRLNPNDPTSLSSMVTHLVFSGDLEKARCFQRRMVEIDPTSYESRVRGYHALTAIDSERALRDAEFARASADTRVAGHDIRAIAFVLRGDLEAAAREAAILRRLAPHLYYANSIDALIAASRNDRGATEAAIAKFENEARRNHWAAIRVAQCYARFGEHAKAVEWIERSIDFGQHNWYGLRKHPWFQSMQSDPAFVKILEELRADHDDVKDEVAGVAKLVCR